MRALLHFIAGLVVASHLLPTVAVTAVMTLFAWNIGWRGPSLTAVGMAVAIGQLSVGWSNDAFDATADARAGRREKPTVSGLVSPRALWACAGVALAVASVLSWLVAGPLGGTFHVFALAMAWLYNVALSRTAWSWLPYALAFGAMPPFLFIGLDGAPAPWWTIAVFAILAVSAHLANALPDLASDTSAGMGGLVVRMGARRSTWLCWLLLGIATGILVMVTWASSGEWWVPATLVLGFLAAVLVGTRSKGSAAMFPALLGVVLLDVLALTLSPAI